MVKRLRTDLPRDAYGFPYRATERGHAFRVTECCGAAVTYHDTTLCCKGCWAEVDAAYDSPAIFEGDQPHVAPPFEFKLPQDPQP
jgi:hypothetical protein